MLENYVADSVQEQAASIPQPMPRNGPSRMTREVAILRSDLMLGRLVRFHPERMVAPYCLKDQVIEVPESKVIFLPTQKTIDSTDDHPSISLIQNIVAEFYGIDVTRMLARRKTSEIRRVRFVAIYLCFNMTTHSMVDIGRRFMRDHTSIGNAVSKIESELKTDECLRDDIDVLKLHIKSAMLKGVA